MNTWKDNVGVPNTLCNPQELADCLMHLKYDCLDTWKPSTTTEIGMCVTPLVPNRFIYECISDGTTGTIHPTFPIIIGNTVTDGTVTWKCSSKAGNVGTSPSAYGEDSWLTPGSYTWTAPDGVNRVSVEIGAGGGGGSRGGFNDAGAGGGAGEYIPSEIIEVVPGTTYSVIVGDGGLGSSSVASDGSPGEDSSFSTVVASGGLGGQRENAGGTPSGGLSGGGDFSVNGSPSLKLTSEFINITLPGCGGKVRFAKFISIGGGDPNIYCQLPLTIPSYETHQGNILANIANNLAGFYTPPTSNGSNGIGFCAGGGGGPWSVSAHSGGKGAPGFVKIRFWKE